MNGGRGSSAGLALALLVLSAACAHHAAGDELDEQLPGRSVYLSALMLPSVSGTPVRTETSSVTVVAFVATWCFPCLDLVPSLIELQTKYTASQVQILAVGMDLEGAKVLGPFADHYGIRFPVLVPSEALRAGRTAFGLPGTLPAVVLLDGRGEYADGFVGLLPRGGLEQAVANLLAKEKAR